MSWRIVLCSLLVALPAAAQEMRLELNRPAQRETIDGTLPLVAIEGRLAPSADQPLDLMIALDASESAFLPTGEDVDGDGLIGALSPRRRRTDERHLEIRASDPGDTVFEAARARARALLTSLPQTARAGLFTFAEQTRVRARLGSPGLALAALDALRAPSRAEATDLSRAIRLGQHLLGYDRAAGRRKVLLVVSDGHATRPGPRCALHAARAAARHGIEIHTIALGAYAAGSSSSYAALARCTGGTYTSSREPLAGLPWAAAAPTALASIEVLNATTGEPGRALRIRGDGRFDGFVRLRPGANRLAIHAWTLEGPQHRESRIVFFDPPGRSTASDRALIRALRARAQEIESSSRRSGSRTLEIEIERSGTRSAAPAQ